MAGGPLGCTRESLMPLSELERKRYEKAVSKFVEARRPPPEIRPKLDLGFRLEGQSVEIFEVRPGWRNPNEKMENSVAKATYVKRAEEWRVYWQRADLNRLAGVRYVDALSPILDRSRQADAA